MTARILVEAGRWALLVLIVAAAQVGLADEATPPSESLVSRIEYRFVGHLGTTNAEGQVLVWEAVADGGLRGEMKWWFTMPPPVAETAYAAGRLTFYSARWEFSVDGEVLLAGVSAGKTDFRDGGDGVWDGSGRVTEARGHFASLRDKLVYETGSVIAGDEPPVTFTGTGLFSIY